MTTNLLHYSLPEKRRRALFLMYRNNLPCDTWTHSNDTVRSCRVRCLTYVCGHCCENLLKYLFLSLSYGHMILLNQFQLHRLNMGSGIQTGKISTACNTFSRIIFSIPCYLKRSCLIVFIINDISDKSTVNIIYGKRYCFSLRQ